jgi:hypothetical protein
MVFVPTNAYRVLESIKANRRLPESHFSALKLASKTQHSVSDLFKTSSSSSDSKR